MGFKEKLTQYYTKSYLKKYGDRITQLQGNAVSVKITEKTILWVFHKLTVSVLVRPDRSKNIVQCIYVKNRWFKKPEFIPITQGNLLIVQGLKGLKGKKGNSELISVMNIRNLSNKRDLVPVEGKVQKIQQRQQKIKH